MHSAVRAVAQSLSVTNRYCSRTVEHIELVFVTAATFDYTVLLCKQT